MKKNEIIDGVKTTNEEFGCSTLRFYFYRLVTHFGLKNNKSQYKQVSKILARARENKILSWNIMVDLERESSGNNPHYTTCEDIIDWTLKDIIDSWKLYWNLWYFQPNHIEVWNEKKTLNPFLEQPINNLGLIYVPSHGYSSVSFLHTNAERLKPIDKPITILYCGDFDPSGIDIQRFITEKLKEYGITNLTVKRVCITQNQISTYKLPTKMSKTSDTRTKKFVKTYKSTDTVELDALHWKIILKLIKHEVRKLKDSTIEARTISWKLAQQNYLKTEIPIKVKKAYA